MVPISGFSDPAATIAGYPVSELVLWATLVYTVLMIGHKVFQIYQDVRGKKGGD